MFNCCVSTVDEKSEVSGVVMQDPETKGEAEATPVVDPIVEAVEPAKPDPPAPDKAPEPAPVKAPEPAPPATAEPAPEPVGVQFGFLSDSGVQYFTLSKKPVGLQFEKKMPIIISGFSEGSRAKDAGIKVGWEMKSVGGVDLTGITNYPDAFKIIKEKLDTLS